MPPLALQLLGLALLVAGLWLICPWLLVVAAGCLLLAWPELARRRRG